VRKELELLYEVDLALVGGDEQAVRPGEGETGETEGLVGAESGEEELVDAVDPCKGLDAGLVEAAPCGGFFGALFEDEHEAEAEEVRELRQLLAGVAHPGDEQVFGGGAGGTSGMVVRASIQSVKLRSMTAAISSSLSLKCQ